jgi:hypothetical protein
MLRRRRQARPTQAFAAQAPTRGRTIKRGKQHRAVWPRRDRPHDRYGGEIPAAARAVAAAGSYSGASNFNRALDATSNVTADPNVVAVACDVDPPGAAKDRPLCGDVT